MKAEWDAFDPCVSVISWPNMNMYSSLTFNVHGKAIATGKVGPGITLRDLLFTLEDGKSALGPQVYCTLLLGIFFNVDLVPQLGLIMSVFCPEHLK